MLTFAAHVRADKNAALFVPYNFALVFLVLKGLKMLLHVD